MAVSADPGRLIRDTRRQRGLTQARLALRAGTTQSAISRIENGHESPTTERLEMLLLVMGERLALASTPLAADDRSLAARRAQTPADRLREAASWNRAATAIEIAGAAARRAGHPATRRAGHPATCRTGHPATRRAEG
jgi:transcriptional regulator with XRE-family HTH domain